MQPSSANGYRCTRCGKASRLEAHHVVWLEHGGADAPYVLDGIATLCRGCHIEEHRTRKPLTAAEQAWKALVDELR